MPRRRQIFSDVNLVRRVGPRSSILDPPSSSSSWRPTPATPCNRRSKAANCGAAVPAADGRRDACTTTDDERPRRRINLGTVRARIVHRQSFGVRCIRRVTVSVRGGAESTAAHTRFSLEEFVSTCRSLGDDRRQLARSVTGRSGERDKSAAGANGPRPRNLADAPVHHPDRIPAAPARPRRRTRTPLGRTTFRPPRSTLKKRAVKPANANRQF